MTMSKLIYINKLRYHEEKFREKMNDNKYNLEID